MNTQINSKAANHASDKIVLKHVINGVEWMFRYHKIDGEWVRSTRMASYKGLANKAERAKSRTVTMQPMLLSPI